MNMDMFRLCAVVVASALFGVLLRKQAPEQAFLAALAVCAGVGLYALPYVAAIRAELESLCSGPALAGLPYVFKALGICLLTQASARICADYGQSALSAQLETAGKLAVLVVSLPLVRELLRAVAALLQ
ncbi:MAG: stage III sporulation AC/AD family protein [Oscillospiraceae bacterium]|nr:stage III sporulation AC/AD family protein [Oscillospiraceae bacterium]